MNNPFLKIKKDKRIALQQRVGNEVMKRKVGRPRKKGMGRYTIRLLQSLHRDISAYCEKHGIGISYFIQSLVVDKFNDIEKDKSE